MNDLMSLGVHRLWKRFTLSLTGLKPGLSGARRRRRHGRSVAGMLRQVGKSGRVVLSDINPAMLERGRDRLLDAGMAGNVDCVVADAESLPFADARFDCVTIGFGLRNVTDKAAALRSMFRVLKPGGQLLVLEFSTPIAPGLQAAYDAYSFNVLPLLGRLVAGDSGSYRYLAESIRMHPPQEALLDMMREAGFEQLALSQSERRYRRTASRVQDLACRRPRHGSGPPRRCSTAISIRRRPRATSRAGCSGKSLQIEIYGVAKIRARRRSPATWR